MYGDAVVMPLRSRKRCSRSSSLCLLVVCVFLFVSLCVYVSIGYVCFSLSLCFSLCVYVCASLSLCVCASLCAWLVMTNLIKFDTIPQS